MDIDPTEPDSTVLKQKSEALQSLATGSLSTSIARLSGSSRGIPSDKDFHFYYLFDEFRAPIDEIAAASQAMLDKIGSSEQFWGSKTANTFPREEIDDDAAYNWLVSVNDEILERLDVSVDEFLRMRKEEEEGGARKAAVDEDGFQLVCGKKKRTSMANYSGDGSGKGECIVSPTSVKVVEKDKKVATAKPKVPFHISTIKRPQDEHKILVNNANQPFEHVWLQKSEDGSRFIHPLELLSVNDFVDRKTAEPQNPAPLADTPFKMVETVKDLKEMAAKLRNADEIAVDLEHNQYRSFQGLTCLMQISTRTEDFVVDTLKLRVHIGPYLREIFKDPSKKKVMHGADRDVVWLQRDFGIYICNLFDTGQASRVLKLERNSLEYLLRYFCDVTANKEYQNAEWRLRPLPHEMIRYAREDTHYLLYIYDVMRARLMSESTVDENSNDLLLEVYQRSYDVCMQLYEKELLTETSYLHVYGLQTANFNAQQLAVASGLYEWRDVVARAEDESTGYILPNKTLMEIAKQMPVTTGKLKHMVRYKHPYIERNLSSVVNIIRHSIQHSAAFEAVVKQLAEARVVVAPEPVASIGEDSVSVPDSSMVDKVNDNSDPVVKTEKAGAGDSSLNLSPKMSHNKNDPNGSVDTQSARQSPAVDRNIREKNTACVERAKATGATVQILKRPSRAFGALLGSSSSKKKVDPSNKEKELTKLEQIKSSVNLPFHSFVGDAQTSKNAAKLPSERDDQTTSNASKGPSEAMDACPSEENDDMHTESKTEDIIQLEGDSDDDDGSPIKSETAGSEHAETKEDSQGKPASGPDDEEDELMSLSDLSTTFNKCLQSSNENHQNKSAGTSEQPLFKPFDYEEARKTIKFGEPVRRSKAGANMDGGSKPGSKSKKGGEGKQQQQGDQSGLPQGRRRQAFPASGNRSATFL